jgi:hypothetical protein
VDKAIQQTIESDPKLYAQPQAVLASISMPGANPVKDAFWTRLMTQIRLTYGDSVSLSDVRDALEQQVYMQANPAQAGAPGMPGEAGKILSPQQEFQTWGKAGQAAEKQRKEQPAPQGAPQGRKPYETGIGSSIKYGLQSLLPIPGEAPPQGQETP